MRSWSATDCREWLVEQSYDQYTLLGEAQNLEPDFNIRFASEDSGVPVEQRLIPIERFEFLAQRIMRGTLLRRIRELVRVLVQNRTAPAVADERALIRDLAQLVLEEAHGKKL